jgi:hypothetical protein
MLLLGIATLSFTGLQDEARLKRAASDMESMARQTLQKAVMEQRLIALNLDGSLGGDGGQVQVKRVGEKVFRKADKGEIWEFSPTGICEPIEVRITHSEGIIEMAFDPLTACAVRKNVIVNSYHETACTTFKTRLCAVRDPHGDGSF